MPPASSVGEATVKRVFVTGATGFIGAALVRRLVADGYEVAALIRPESNPWRLGDSLDKVRVIHGSLESLETLEPALADFRPDTVMHLAWHGVEKARRNDPAQVRTNVCASVDLLLAAARAGCRAFLGAGSQAEYGPSREVLAEDSPTRPVSLYGAAKLATYVLLSQLATQHDMRFAWLRIFSVYGPQDDPGTLVSYVVNELLSRRPPAVSKAEHLWDYLYVDDAASAFIATGESQAAGIFNVASGHARPLRDMITRLRDGIDPASSIDFGAIPEPPSGAYPLRAGIANLERVGWKPATAIDHAVSQTVAWYRDHSSSSL
jgi:UDP-glucose 4-epimerase